MKKYIFLLSTHLLINSLAILYSADIWVMPPQYAFVVAKNNSGGWSNTRWGSISKWQYIVLWGRVSSKLQGKYYRWDFGDGTKTSWSKITFSNYTFLSGWKDGYNVKGDDDITYYVAKLEIADDSSGKNVDRNPSATVLVKAVDFGKITPAYGYDKPEEDKRLILESIAKGRGLTWLYRRQYSDGHWDGETASWGNNTFAGTGIALCAYLIYGHSVYDPQGEKDIFTKTVNDGIYWILKNIDTSMNASDSDINNDGKMYGVTYERTCGNMYDNGIVMLAFAASKNSTRERAKIKDLYPDLASKYGNRTYKDFLSNLVDYASYAQNDGSSYDGSWRYYANYGNGDLSVTQWPVLGLTAIEDVWGIKALSFVKNRLLGYIRRAQYQGGTYDGMGYYDGVPSSDSPAYNGTPSAGKIVSSGDHSESYLVGTNSLLQCMFYISLDTTTLVNLCQCGATDCNDNKKDFKLDKDNPENSCRRVKAAIDFLGRNWLTPPFNTKNYGGPAYYTMYGIMKALRLYHYVKGGVNDGKIYEGQNFPSSGPPSGTSHQWEDEYIDFVLRDMKEDSYLGYWEGDFGTKNIATAFALLILSETVYTPGLIKTQLPKKIYDMFDEFKEYDYEIAKVYEKETIRWAKY